MLVKQRIGLNVFLMAVAMVAATALVMIFSSSSFADNNSANVFKVTPVRSDIQVEPGASKSVQTTVTNLTGSAISVHPIENDFVAGDEDGTPAIILDENTYAPTHSLKRFMAPLPDITIPAGQSKTINVVINVPASAQAGGYFGAIRFAPTSLDGGGQVNLSPSVASLILLTVPGETVEKLNLTNFDIQQNGQTGSYFQTPKNLGIYVRFENKGNVQLGPFGKISVKKGNTVVYATDFNSNDPRDVILPDSARRWDVPLKNIDSFGHYTVVSTFTYGSKNQTIDITKSFWVVPFGVIIGVIAGIFVLAALIVGIWLFLQNYKRRILRQHNRHSNDS